jgi:hypothetical protein
LCFTQVNSTRTIDHESSRLPAGASWPQRRGAAS